MNFYREYVTKWTNSIQSMDQCTSDTAHDCCSKIDFFFDKLSMRNVSMLFDSNYSRNRVHIAGLWRHRFRTQNNFFLERGLNNWSQTPFKANGIDNCAFLREWINFTLENGIEICKWSHQLNSLVSFNIRISLPLNCKVIVMCLKRKIKIFNFKLCLILITDLAGWYECEWKFAQLRKIGWIAKDNVLFLMTWVIWIDPKKTPQCCEEQNREKMF